VAGEWISDGGDDFFLGHTAGLRHAYHARQRSVGERSGIATGRDDRRAVRLDSWETHMRAITNLFDWRIDSTDACLGLLGRRRSGFVRLPQAVHTCVFAPTGAGKGVSCIVPFLRTDEESAVVIDPKGENAMLTASHRDKLGHQIVMLDPYRVVTQFPDTFNPLDFIDETSRLAIDECNDLANALVVRTGDEKEPHWNDSAEAHLAAIIATTVAYGEKDNNSRSLMAVREILSNPNKLEMAIRLMTESKHWGGLLAQMGGQLMHFVDKEKSSALTTTLRHLRFLGTPAIAESTQTSSFNPDGLRKGKMTVFLILPPDHMHAQSGLLRMWIASLIKACVRGGLQ
jgi:type IV secretion system protein VirD4